MAQPFPNITTNRLELRQLEPADAQQIFTLRSSEEINKYLDREPAKTIEDGLRFIHKINLNISGNDSMFWGITLKGQHALIGTICIYNWNKTAGIAEVGYELLPEHWGKGLMHECMQHVVQFAFETMKLQTLEAWMHPGNTRSAHLLESLHFTFARKLDEPPYIIYELPKPAI